MTIRTLTALVVPMALVAMSACTDGSGKDSSVGEEADADTDTDTDTDADADADTDTDTDTDTDADADFNANVSGVVQWADGSAADGLQMRLCYGTCRVTNTDASGAWSYEGVENLDHTLQAVVLADTSYAVPHSVVMLRDDETRTLTEPLRMTKFVTNTDVSGTATVDGDGITIEADRSTMTQGAYTPDYDQYYVATVEVDPATAGISWDGLVGTPVAMWYLGNFDTTLSPSAPFTTASSYGLEDGAKVEIFVTSNEDHGWISGGTATVADGKIISDTGCGIPKLNTMVLVAL
jgi:hypothetical protein